MKNHKKGIAYAVLSALLWGVVSVVMKIALTEADPITVVWVRMTIAFLGVAVYYVAKQPKAFVIFKRPPPLLCLAAVALAVHYAGYSLGVEYAGPATTQVVVQLGVILLCLSGFFIFKEKFYKRQIFGFTLTFFGLFFFYNQQLASMHTGQAEYVKGVVIIVLSAITWAVYSVNQKKLVQQYEVQQVNMFLYGFAAIAYLPFVQFSDFVGMSLEVWLILVFLGLNTLIAYGSIGLALKYTDAGKVSVVIILNPIITFVLLELMQWFHVDWIVIEHVPFWAYVGAVLMLVGAILAVVTPSRESKKELSMKNA